MRMTSGIVLLVLGQGLAGCGGGRSLAIPSAPSQVTPAPVPSPGQVGLAVFSDSATGFSTSDVHDAQDQIVRFEADELILAAIGARFQEFIVDGNFIDYHHKGETFLQIRFGTTNGERRAYVTWPDERLNGRPPAVLDLWVDERGDLKITDTLVPVPGT